MFRQEKKRSFFILDRRFYSAHFNIILHGTDNSTERKKKKGIIIYLHLKKLNKRVYVQLVMEIIHCIPAYQ